MLSAPSPQRQNIEVFPMNPEVGKVQSYPWFDWLRFLLASIVVLGHAGFTFATFITGGLAVSVFFSLSGWLIGGILLRTNISELPRFFFNRSTRIWIPYFVAVILLYGVAAMREGINFFWLKYLVMDVTFTHQLFTFFPVAKYEMPLDGSGNQFWSLAVEEQFYLVAPLIMLFVPKGKTLAIWLLISVIALLFNSHAAPISLGVCAAILHRDYEIANKLWVRFLAMCLMIGSAIALSKQFGLNYFTPLFSVAVVVFLAAPGPRNKVAFFLGGLSFPLYLNHWIGLFLIHGSAKHLGLLELPSLPFIAYLTAVATTIPLYLFIDRQVLNRRNEWFTTELGYRIGLIAYFLVVTGIVVGILLHQYGPHGVIQANKIMMKNEFQTHINTLET